MHGRALSLKSTVAAFDILHPLNFASFCAVTFYNLQSNLCIGKFHQPCDNQNPTGNQGGSIKGNAMSTVRSFGYRQILQP